MSNNESEEQISTNAESISERATVEYEKVEELLLNMTKDADILRRGYSLVANYEKNKYFYLNILKVIFSSEQDIKVKKLAASTFKIFLNKNWCDDEYMTNEERMVSFEYNFV